jgi:hypothetical protein
MLQRQVLDLLASKATAVMTNVPGPNLPLYMAGSRLKQMMFWVPQSGDIGVGLSILSYAGSVQFGLITDKELCRDPQAIIDRFAPEFENLVHAVLLMPWDSDVPAEMARRSLEAADHLSHREGSEEQAAAKAAAQAEIAVGRPELQLPASRAAGKKSRAKSPVVIKTVAAKGRGAKARLTSAAAGAGSSNGSNGRGVPAGLRKRKSAFAAARGR